MKNEIVNLEYRVEINLDSPDFKSEDLERISEAWGLGDYRIWFDMKEIFRKSIHFNISISWHGVYGVDITRDAGLR